MAKEIRDAVNKSVAGFLPLARFAIAWANDAHSEGKNAQDWIDGYEEFQWQNMSWGDELFFTKSAKLARNDRDRVIVWLQELFNGSMSPSLTRELEGQIEKIDGRSGINWVPEYGQLVMTHCFRGKPLELAAAGIMGLASLPLRDGFGLCDWCGRYFLETEVRPGRRKRIFCPDRPCGVSARQDRFKGGTGKKGGL